MITEIKKGELPWIYYKKKAYDFALRIVKLSEYLQNERKEFILSRKILDSGTNIGLLIEEGEQGESRPDFIQKYSVANKGVQDELSPTLAEGLGEDYQATCWIDAFRL